ncbi:MAG: hypothetical protein Q8P53_03840 [Candidatus Shapirobacteria bacterium]|nr:hypothetical protein [Candidatus Shapirobacteria bacterium]
MKTLSRELIIELGEILKEEKNLNLDFETLSKLANFLVEYFQLLLVQKNEYETKLAQKAPNNKA